MPQDGLACSGGRREERRRPFLALKDGDNALGNRAFAFPIASPSSLQYGIQSGEFPLDNGKINVYTCFNQRGGNHTAGQAIGKPAADFRNLFLTVGRTHQCRKVENTVAIQLPEQRLRAFAGVYDTENLLLRVELFG